MTSHIPITHVGFVGEGPSTLAETCFLRLQGPSLKIHVICESGSDRVCLVWFWITVPMYISVFASHFMAFVCNLAGSIRD